MKATIGLEVKTPVFIGSGNKLNRWDYFVNERKQQIVVMQQEKWVGLLNREKRLNHYLTEVGNPLGWSSLTKWVVDNKMEKYIQECTQSTIALNGIQRFKTNEIDLFVRDFYGTAYIPGSTLKGFFLSALVDYRMKGMGFQDFFNGYEKTPALMEKALGADYKDKMSKLLLSDSTTIPDNAFLLMKKEDVNARTKQASQSLPIYRESVQPNTKVTFELTIVDESLFTIEELMAAIQYRTQRILGEEGVIGKFFKDTAQYLPVSIEGNGIYGILGGGTGFHSKTNVMAAANDPKRANQETRTILMRGPQGIKKHQHDDPLSPNRLKIGKVYGKEYFLGLVQLTVMPAKKI